jgi:secreted trypsin-like serine protease
MSDAQANAADPLQEHVDAAERLADLVAGGDESRSLLAFEALINVADDLMARPGPDEARALMAQSAEPHSTRPDAPSAPISSAAVVPSMPSSDSIYADPVYQRNAREVRRNRKRIVGGVETADFPDCVAIGSPGDWCCTGTLVAPNVVVTAGHCEAGGCSARVFVGTDVTGDGQVVEVARAVAHPDYGPSSDFNDIAVLILQEDLNIEPRAIAKQADVDGAISTRLAGFGNTDVNSSGGYGKRRMVDVPMASTNPQFGADSDSEFVAGAPFLDRDSCNGDSGGPAYVECDDGWALAGATSRATASAFRPCGDGGIYTRVHAFEDWIRSVPGGSWA